MFTKRRTPLSSHSRSFMPGKLRSRSSITSRTFLPLASTSSLPAVRVRSGVGIRTFTAIRSLLVRVRVVGSRALSRRAFGRDVAGHIGIGNATTAQRTVFLSRYGARPQRTAQPFVAPKLPGGRGIARQQADRERCL